MAGRKKATAPEPFPLPEGHYFSTPATAPRSHSSGHYVRMLNEKFGLHGEIFNSNTRAALMSWQAAAGLRVTGVVDAETWERLLAPEEEHETAAE